MLNHFFVAEQILSLGPSCFLGDKQSDHLQALDLMSPSSASAAPRLLARGRSRDDQLIVGYIIDSSINLWFMGCFDHASININSWCHWFDYFGLRATSVGGIPVRPAGTPPTPRRRYKNGRPMVTRFCSLVEGATTAERWSKKTVGGQTKGNFDKEHEGLTSVFFGVPMGQSHFSCNDSSGCSEAVAEGVDNTVDHSRFWLLPVILVWVITGMRMFVWLTRYPSLAKLQSTVADIVIEQDRPWLRTGGLWLFGPSRSRGSTSDSRTTKTPWRACWASIRMETGEGCEG